MKFEIVGARENRAPTNIGKDTMTVPTKLILLRILLIPVFLGFFFAGLNVIALVIFAIAALTDFFDGRIARRCNQVTDFYKIMDPLADKLLICSALIAFVWTREIAVWLVILIVCRDFIVTGLRLFAAAQNVVLGAVISGKVNTAFQMILIMFVLVGFDPAWAEPIKQILVGIVATLTIISLVENFIRNRKIIGRIKL